MKLLEIVRGAATAPDVIATALALARRMGKQPVVARNGDGFIGNRIFALYRRHAEYLVEDGASPIEVDAALETYGFAMGIFAVSDLSGLDIALAMRRRRDATRSPDERYVDIADRLCAAGRLGRKTGAGWYAYGADGRKRPDPAVADMIAAGARGKGHHATALHDARNSAPPRRRHGQRGRQGARRRHRASGLRHRSRLRARLRLSAPERRAHVGGRQDRPRHHSRREIEAAHRAGGAGSAPATLLIDLARSGGTFSDWRP